MQRLRVVASYQNAKNIIIEMNSDIRNQKTQEVIMNHQNNGIFKITN